MSTLTQFFGGGAGGNYPTDFGFDPNLISVVSGLASVTCLAGNAGQSGGGVFDPTTIQYVAAGPQSSLLYPLVMSNDNGVSAQSSGGIIGNSAWGLNNGPADESGAGYISRSF